MADYGARLARKVIELGLADPKKMRGCSRRTVERISRRAAGGRLPRVYVEVLCVMGRDTGGEFLRDLVYRAASLAELQQDAKAIADADGIALPADAFFFAAGSGTHFFFFRPADGDDPPVHLFTEAKPPFQVTERLTDFLDGLALDYAGQAGG